MQTQISQRKKVLCPIEKKGGRTHWVKIGAAFENRDGSWNIHLDTIPYNGKLQVRDLDERDLKKADDKNDDPRSPAFPRDKLPF